eukprot:CAMPEP_0204511096 /NCGR_PEP_ID=MMETSP0661-20131031/237_1 /ASSEMBLY_ACC=CAM_ASM_000606 /TAXON_ID=109239 /ORGANISM="Alexandrium margalefi, Strain AMGDE01CS-322" /LENGTH=258 /DNA_ID=CAMNT_0051516155 /DNA_START=111 /DNA_END=889 /DNA_ORIENTATION=-
MTPKRAQQQQADAQRQRPRKNRWFELSRPSPSAALAPINQELTEAADGHLPVAPAHDINARTDYERECNCTTASPHRGDGEVQCAHPVGVALVLQELLDLLPGGVARDSRCELGGARRANVLPIVVLLNMVAPLAHAEALLAEALRQAPGPTEAGEVTRRVGDARDAIPRRDVQSARRVPAVAVIAIARAKRAMRRPTARRAAAEHAAAHDACVHRRGALGEDAGRGAAAEAHAEEWEEDEASHGGDPTAKRRRTVVA